MVVAASLVLASGTFPPAAAWPTIPWAGLHLLGWALLLVLLPLPAASRAPLFLATVVLLPALLPAASPLRPLVDPAFPPPHAAGSVLFGWPGAARVLSLAALAATVGALLAPRTPRTPTAARRAPVG